MTIIIIVVAVLILLWGIGVQNALVKLDEFCKNALKQINVQQISRFDAIKALVKIMREYSAFESETLLKVVEARSMSTSSAPLASEVDSNEKFLAEVSTKLVALAEAYPDLKANQQYLKTMDDIKSYEENVRLGRMTFNDTVTKYNKKVRMFPGSLVASILGFAQREYLAEDRSKADFPEI